MSNASRRWVKVWHEILNDSHFQELSLEQQARWYTLLVFISSQGKKGKVYIPSPARVLISQLQCRDFDHLIECVSALPNLKIEVDIDYAGISVTFKKWSKFQVDSTASERQKKYRAGQTGNALRKETEKEKEKEQMKELFRVLKDKTDQNGNRLTEGDLSKAKELLKQLKKIRR